MSDRRYGADEHNADYERGREDERAAIVAALWTHIEPLVTWISDVNVRRLRGADE